MEEKILCIECGEYHDECDVAYIESVDGCVCQSCLDELYTQCNNCYKYVRNDKTFETQDGDVCESCYDNHYIECENCGDCIHKNDSYGTEDGYVCESCYDNYYYTCEDCGTVIHVDNVHWVSDYAYCEECADNHRESEYISEYHDVDDWVEHYVENKNEGLLKGFELEVDNGQCNEETCEELDNILGSLVVYEEDGSLNDGFEIITHPMTMQYFESVEDKFKEALQTLKDNGYTSHDNNTCGLHVHVNKETLATSSRTQDEVIDNIILIMETFKSELTKFSRRKQSQIDSWSQFLTDISNETLSYDFVKKQKGKHGRYVALNVSNDETIEFRIFKGTLKFETLKATLQLVDNICCLARKDVNGLTWDDIINFNESFTELKEYNSEREITSEKSIKMYD